MKYYMFMSIVLLLLASTEAAVNDQGAFNFDATIFTNYCGEILVDKEMVEKVSKMEDRGKQEIYLVKIANKEIDKELKEKQPSKFMSECLKKTTAIRLLGKTPGTNYIDLLINEISFSDPNIKKGQKCPAIQALIDKGEDAEDALWHFFETAELKENYTDENESEFDRIRGAIWALQAINRNDSKYYEELEKKESKIDRQIWQQLWF